MADGRWPIACCLLPLVYTSGGKCVGVYTTNEAEACGYIAKHSECAVAIVDNERQLAKYLAAASTVPTLKAIVMYAAPSYSP